MSEQFRAPPRKKTALDNIKLKLFANNSENKRAGLLLSIVKNNPRLTVYTNVEADKAVEYGQIKANMSTLGWQSCLILLQTAIDFRATADEPEWKSKCMMSGTAWFGGKPSQSPEHQSDVWVGSDKEGVVWISVQAPANKNRPRIKFDMVPDEFHTFYHKSGEQWSKAEASRLWAQSYLNTMKDISLQLQVTNWEEPPPKEGKPGQGGGGGYGRQGGGNGGGNGGSNYRQAAQPEEDLDLPF